MMNERIKKELELVNFLIEEEPRFFRQKRVITVEPWKISSRKALVRITYSNGETETVPLSILLRSLV